MEEFLKYIPLDKSWINRMGMLDMLHGYDDIVRFLEKQQDLGDDLLALKRVAEKWNTEEPLNVGESGTLYRFVRFSLWKKQEDRKIIKEGSLLTRDLCDNPEIINWPLQKLLDSNLDGGTTQWVSAAIINGNTERIKIPKGKEEKINLSYEAREHYKQRKEGKCWIPRYDKTIERQARVYIGLLKKNDLDFTPKHSEDYCFARAFNIISQSEGEYNWPQLKNHESNRIKEMEDSIKEAEKYQKISSKDHRVIQAIVMLQSYLGKKVHVEHPCSVKKSWSLFWEFMDYCNRIKAG